jgi:hypothetical protein
MTVDLESLKRHLDEDERDLDPANPYEAHILHWVAAARKVLAGFEAVANNPDRLTDAALHLQFNVLRQVVEAIASVYGEET